MPRITHGMSKTKLYSIFRSMHERCECRTHRAYGYYGARGISVCDRWRDFNNFVSDMGHPLKGYSLDRIDNNKGYSPENCRWATRLEQQNNTRATHLVEHDGEVLSISQWAKKIGVSRNRIRTRLQRGMSIQDALFKSKLNSWNGPSNRRKKYTPKTHCKNGHEFTAENTGRQTNGSRRCLTCHKSWRPKK